MNRAVWPDERRKRLRDTLIAVAWAVGFFLFLTFVLIKSAIAGIGS